VLDQEEPSNDDAQAHAGYRQRRSETMADLLTELAAIEPTAKAADRHSALLGGLQGAIDFHEPVSQDLQTASSASEVLNGPLSAESEMVSGRVLSACQELLDVARELGIQVDLVCGSSKE